MSSSLHQIHNFLPTPDSTPHISANPEVNPGIQPWGFKEIISYNPSPFTHTRILSLIAHRLHSLHTAATLLSYATHPANMTDKHNTKIYTPNKSLKPSSHLHVTTHDTVSPTLGRAPSSRRHRSYLLCHHSSTRVSTFRLFSGQRW